MERSNGSGTDLPDRNKAKERNREREQGEAAAKVGGEVVAGHPDMVGIEQANPIASVRKPRPTTAILPAHVPAIC